MNDYDPFAEPNEYDKWENWEIRKQRKAAPVLLYVSAIIIFGSAVILASRHLF